MNKHSIQFNIFSNSIHLIHISNSNFFIKSNNNNSNIWTTLDKIISNILEIKMLIFYFMNENKVKQLINSNKNNLSNNQLFLNFYKN